MQVPLTCNLPPAQGRLSPGRHPHIPSWMVRTRLANLPLCKDCNSLWKVGNLERHSRVLHQWAWHSGKNVRVHFDSEGNHGNRGNPINIQYTLREYWKPNWKKEFQILQSSPLQCSKKSESIYQAPIHGLSNKYLKDVITSKAPRCNANEILLFQSQEIMGP